ncbi:MAG: gamma-glutamyl-gamma-aminobutyrate hydrolase family protein [Rickettsiales bacterium]|nr:gamma-glutamyl-gamma-aminobutyrate hydrolase family protein [Rickettsiales bacterium]MCA0254661.1 gamma-glutamyl-gamma-aminobutyrate hydrolase family protein [Pseudomonadota bacterium]
MRKKPVIGIVLDSANDSEKYSYAKRPWYALRKDYSDSVDMAGGFPIMLTHGHHIDDIINIVDGLVIPGGDEDIHPQFYGQEIKSSRVKTNDQRAVFELELVKRAIKHNLPILGICNGLQVINVALGGTLIQHIPDFIDSPINHEQPHPKHLPSHPIIIEKGTALSSLSTDLTVMVNTTHHQAIDQLGKDLIVSAKAPDGIIEAVEHHNHPYLIGVQWHAEYINSELDSNLFKRLVAVSAKVV